jgi:hypothetical protein
VGGGGGGGVAIFGIVTVRLICATFGDVVPPATGPGTVPVVLLVVFAALFFDELPMK